MPRQAKTLTARSRLPPAMPEGTYLCERILDLKIERGQRHYLIKWQGYDDPADNTWEPLCNLEYLLEDLIDYEQAHTARIQQVEEQWRRMFREGTVTQPLQEIDIAQMQDELDRLEEPSNTPEDTPPPVRSRHTHHRHAHHREKKPNKAKHISKKRDLATGKRELRSAATPEQKNAGKSEGKNEAKTVKSEKEGAKKRGRRPYKSIAMPKLEMQTDHLQVLRALEEQHSKVGENRELTCSPAGEEQAEGEREQSHHFLTPERSIQQVEDGKKTKSQERALKYEASLSDEEVPKEDCEFFDHSLLERQQLNNEINSYFQDFAVENSVAEVLSRRISPSATPPAEEGKRESFFKHVGSGKQVEASSRGGCTSSLHPSTKKFLMYRKRKCSEQRSESESDSHHSALKGFPSHPIIELEEEQKESSPVSSICQRHQEERAELQEDRQQEERPLHEDEQALLEEDEQAVSEQENHQIPDGKAEEAMVRVEDEPFFYQEDEIPAEQASQPKQTVPPALQIEETTAIKSDSPHFSEQILEKEGEMEREDERKDGRLESITAILDIFHKSSSIDADRPLPASRKKVELIDIDSSSSSKERHPSEGHKFCALPVKTKRIKKEAEGRGRGIVGRSGESLVQEREGEVRYRPSLNTLLQGMLSESEVRLEEPKVLRLTSSFRMENVILFAAQVQTAARPPQTRFVCYQTLRQHYPRELLAFLEDNGLIEL